MTEESTTLTAQMKFDDPEEPHDIVLIVDDTRFYYSKIHLAKQSDYFKTMFFGNFAEKDKKEITLKDPESAEEFQTFLNVINAVDSLTATNVEGILCLSDLWQAPIVQENCLKFLMEDAETTTKEKFDLAIQYGFDDLKTKALSEITTREELYELAPDDHSDWDQSTTELVFEKYKELAHYGRVFDFHELYFICLRRERAIASRNREEGNAELSVAQRNGDRLKRLWELFATLPDKRN